MPPFYILTDSAAQFIHSTFPGKDMVRVIPLTPAGSSAGKGYLLAAPSDQEVQLILKTASQNAGTVFAILTSGCLSALPGQILRLMKESSAAPRIVMLDTLSTGVGTGFVVEKTAEMAAAGKSNVEIERKIRHYCTAIYTAVILPDLSSLVPIGLVDQAQANAASILGIQSVFSMEDGLPTPLVKVRNQHSAYEYLVEFLDEFEKFHLVALVQESGADAADLQIITDHLMEFFPGVELLTFPSNQNWHAIFGQKSYGLVVISNEDNL
jgi:fatty acid-binding protein DegV